MEPQEVLSKVLKYIKHSPKCTALEISDNIDINLWVVYQAIEELYKDKKIDKHFKPIGVLYTIKKD